jgi:hypothetical protein
MPPGISRRLKPAEIYKLLLKKTLLHGFETVLKVLQMPCQKQIIDLCCSTLFFGENRKTI